MHSFSGKLQVNASITIDSILEITEISSSMVVKLVLNVSWIDKKLEYINLKDNEFLNALTSQQKISIWSPSLKFSNTRNEYVATFKDDLSTGTIKLKPNTIGQIAGLIYTKNQKKYSGNDG